MSESRRSEVLQPSKRTGGENKTRVPSRRLHFRLNQDVQEPVRPDGCGPARSSGMVGLVVVTL